MAEHQITCVTKETVQSPSPHQHIASVGTADGNRYTVQQVIAKMNAGDTFYTKTPSATKRAGVESYTCSTCKAPIIRTKPDAELSNNLDNLPKCP